MRSLTNFVLISIILLSFGCEFSNQKSEWEVSPTFKAGNLTLYGNKGKFGIIRMNGNNEKELFVVGQGGLYFVYFWGDPKVIYGRYKLIATNKETKEEIKLYEWPIQLTNNETGSTAHSGGKFALNKSGLWRLDVFLNNNFFDSIIVDVKEGK